VVAHGGPAYPHGSESGCSDRDQPTSAGVDLRRFCARSGRWRAQSGGRGGVGAPRAPGLDMDGPGPAGPGQGWTGPGGDCSTQLDRAGPGRTAQEPEGAGERAGLRAGIYFEYVSSA
jgi:hypothetical protein